jgi:MFS family permease
MSFRRSQVAIAALFCFLGFQYGTWVSRVPYLKSHLDLSTVEVGLLLLAPGIGATVSFPLVARLMKQLGSRMLCIASAFALLVILAALSVSSTFWVAIVVLFLDGILIACLNVAMNAQGADLETKFERNTMARLHAVFSGGTFASALLASAVTSFTTKLPLHFLIAGILLLGLLAVSWTGLLPADTPPDTAEAAADASPSGKRRWAIPSMVVLGLGIAMIFSELTEGAMNDWSALYLRDVTHAATSVTPLGIATVSAMMVLARLFADSWRAKWGDKRVVLVGTVLAAVGLGAALLAAPCIYVAAAKHGPDALALVAATGTAGLLVGPPIIGFVAGASSLVWGMTVVVVAIVLVFVSVTRIQLGPATSPDSPAETPVDVAV